VAVWSFGVAYWHVAAEQSHVWEAWGARHTKTVRGARGFQGLHKHWHMNAPDLLALQPLLFCASFVRLAGIPVRCCSCMSVPG
jgi:hypothetical protein